MVFTTTACRSDPRAADAFWISRHISKAPRFEVIVHFTQNSVEFARGDITLHPLVPLVIVPTVEPSGELSARSSNESCSIGVLISAKLGANNRRRPDHPGTWGTTRRAERAL